MILAPVGIVLFVINFAISFEDSSWAHANQSILSQIGALAFIVGLFSSLIVITQVPSGKEGEPLPMPTQVEKAASKFAQFGISAKVLKLNF